MHPKGRHTPSAVPNPPFFLLFCASWASSAQAAALAPQLAVVAVASATTPAFFTCRHATTAASGSK